MLVNLNKVNKITFLAPIKSLSKLELKQLQLTRKNNHFFGYLQVHTMPCFQESSKKCTLKA